MFMWLAGIFPPFAPNPYDYSLLNAYFMGMIGSLFGTVSFVGIELAVGTAKLAGSACGIRSPRPPSVAATPKPNRYQFTMRTLLLGVIFLSLPFS